MSVFYLKNANCGHMTFSHDCLRDCSDLAFIFQGSPSAQKLSSSSQVLSFSFLVPCLFLPLLLTSPSRAGRQSPELILKEWKTLFSHGHFLGVTLEKCLLFGMVSEVNGGPLLCCCSPREQVIWRGSS